MNLIFNIQPVPASRPRVTRWGVYYGKKYSQFRIDMEVSVREMLKDFTPITKPLFLEVEFLFTMPKSWSKKKKEEFDGKYIISTPDLDNLEKALYDSLNGFLYEDDSQIVKHTVSKRWVKDEGSIKVKVVDNFLA